MMQNRADQAFPRILLYPSQFSRYCKLNIRGTLLQQTSKFILWRKHFLQPTYNMSHTATGEQSQHDLNTNSAFKLFSVWVFALCLYISPHSHRFLLLFSFIQWKTPIHYTPLCFFLTSLSTQEVYKKLLQWKHLKLQHWALSWTKTQVWCCIGKTWKESFIHIMSIQLYCQV